MRRAALPLLLALTLPAAAHADGNVTTTQTGESITIKGDAADNDFDVKHGTDAMGNDVLVIEGKNGTTINGQPKFEIRLDPDPNRFESISIESSGGGDDVTVDLSGLPEGLRLDELKAAGDADGTTTIKNVRTTPKGDIDVRTGGTIVIEACDADNIDILGGGDGSVTVKECNVTKKIALQPGVEGNEITIQDSFFGDVKNKSGNPVNVQNRSQFRILRSTGRKVSYSGSEAEDEIAFEDSTIEQVSLKLGGGNDLASFAGSTIEKVSVDGGAGDADCLDETQGGNLFGSFKTKGFEPCDDANLAFQSGAGSDALDPETWPEDAVAWRTVNPEAGHLDGPFALPGQGALLGLPERDPSMLAPPAHWGLGPECVAGPVQLQHVHDAWEGHSDPDDEGCGHGFLEWGFFLPG